MGDVFNRSYYVLEKLCALNELPWAFESACHKSAASDCVLAFENSVFLVLSYSLLPSGGGVLFS